MNKPKQKCWCCDKHKIEYRDYRYIDGYCEGKTLVCYWCNGLNDVDLYKVMSKSLDPKDFHEIDEEDE